MSNTKFHYRPGWNREKVIAQVKKYNDGNWCGLFSEITDDLMPLYLNLATGCRCTVGCFMPDGHLALKSEHVIKQILLNDYPDLNEHMPIQEIQGMQKFQEITHDYLRNESTAGLDTVYMQVEFFLDEFMVDG